MRNLVWYAVVALLGIASASASAGVTIHYEGQAKNEAAVDQVIAVLREEAKRNGWQSREASFADVSLKRVINEKDVPYRGPVRGVLVQAHPDCEPLYVQFDSDFFIQDFVKTQFAGAEVHVQVIQLLKKIQPLFTSLTVEDEGEYWETSNKQTLENHIAKVNSLITEMKKSKPGLKGPVTLPSGRIVDLMR